MHNSNDNPHVNEYQHVAIILVDMINDFDFPEADMLFESALPAAKNIANLKKQAKELDIPVLYVNDNYGRWQSDFPALVGHCKDRTDYGKKITELIEPEDNDYFILKPQYSGFFMTPLELLLDYLNVKSLIITGVAGNMCVHFTANDAFMRGYKLYIPSDCTASNRNKDNKEALDLMREVLHANIDDSTNLNLKTIKYEWTDESGKTIDKN
ncbi:isochorismatase [Salipaludibacillus neizhouensis]|uniref:Isochorismatase n=1 Tax=Salipaludibacillus neizhouensis TaxID=885475 RepID=A0A3A9JWY7_9BACI|nr:isochorismatase family cysteine hydrolase [Salipaludibacillus neizhouensis]RKL64987.1 isochorismatase [Salipaludibacillus neizhouensis]